MDIWSARSSRRRRFLCWKSYGPRTVSQAIKRALWARDAGCRFPSCGRRRFVDAHHIEHWSAGGETSLANLMLLCPKHHTLVHEGGFRIEKDYRDCWFFRRPDGRAVPACGYRATDMRDEDMDTEDDYFAAHPSVHTSAEGSRVAEPSAEVYRARRPSAETLIFFSSAKFLCWKLLEGSNRFSKSVDIQKIGATP